MEALEGQGVRAGDGEVFLEVHKVARGHVHRVAAVGAYGVDTCVLSRREHHSDLHYPV